MTAIKPAKVEDIASIDLAIGHLRKARELLREAGASKRCIDRVRKALTSAGGAARHVRHRAHREDMRVYHEQRREDDAISDSITDKVLVQKIDEFTAKLQPGDTE